MEGNRPGTIEERKVRRCAKCVLPESAPRITFNAEGVCNYCHSHRKHSPPGIEYLLQILDETRLPGSPYDCLVAVSGGRDSVYALLKLARDHGRKVLAVHYDNPFSHPQAEKNLNRAVATLGVKLVTYRLKGDLHQRTLKSNLRAWLRRPRGLMVNMICLACRSLEWEPVWIAKRHRIGCIVGAGTPLEDTVFSKALLGSTEAESYAGAIVKGWGKIVREIVADPAYLSPSSVYLSLRGYIALVRDLSPFRFLRPGIIKTSLFSYIKWDEEEIESRIKSELGWSRPPESESSWRFDCRVGLIKDLMYRKTLGMTERDDYYSQQVREGLITRREALRRLENEGRIDPDQVMKLFSDLGLGPARARELMGSERPNNDGI